MADPFIAEIRMLPYGFAPRSWAFCDGSLVSIQQNTALYSIIGTIYGGNGRTNCGLPDMWDGRVPMQQGTGPGLTPRTLGEKNGARTVTLTEEELPNHDHDKVAVANAAPADITDDLTPDSFLGWALNSGGGAAKAFAEMQPPTTALAFESVGQTGGNLDHENRQPFLCVPFCIALDGYYPPRP